MSYVPNNNLYSKMNKAVIIAAAFGREQCKWMTGSSTTLGWSGGRTAGVGVALGVVAGSRHLPRLECGSTSPPLSTRRY